MAAGRPASLERFRGERGTPRERRPLLSIGDQVRVGQTDSLSNLLSSGWWEVENDIVWSRGRESVIDFDLDLGQARSCNLALSFTPFVNDAHPTLSVEVRINRRHRATWVYAAGAAVDATQRIAVPETTLDHGRCEIVFIVQGSSSPLASGVSNDARVLGVAFRSLTIEPVDIYPPAVDASVRVSLDRATERPHGVAGRAAGT